MAVEQICELYMLAVVGVLTRENDLDAGIDTDPVILRHSMYR